MKCDGVEVLYLRTPNAVTISPITSKGVVSDACYIEIPAANVVEVAQEMALRTGEEVFTYDFVEDVAHFALKLGTMPTNRIVAGDDVIVAVKAFHEAYSTDVADKWASSDYHDIVDKFLSTYKLPSKE